MVERRSEALAKQIRLVAARAAQLPVDLPPAGHGLGGRRLRRARGDEHRQEEGDPHGAWSPEPTHKRGVRARSPTLCIMRPVQASASLRDVTVVLDNRPILRDVTIDVGSGLTVVRGLNGAGKTTLLRALAGLVPLARGSRTVRGDALYIGHRPMLLRGLTARENLTFYARFRGLTSDGVEAALADWGLREVMDRPVERLSAGERRRASLARLETEGVPLLLLDEPFAELDERAATRLSRTIERAREDGRAVVVATHAHHELDPVAIARIAVDDGVATAA